MSAPVNWLADIAGDSRNTATTVRLACAVAGLSSLRGRYRGRLVALAAAAQLSSRHAPEMLQDLAKRGFLRIHTSQGGRLDIEMVMPPHEAAPTTDKPFRQIAGNIVGILGGGKGPITAYLETDDQMLKLTIPRADAEAIAAAVNPPAP